MRMGRLADFVKLDTALRVQEGNPVEIADSCRAQLNVARATHKDLTVWALGASIGTMAVALENLERVLAQHELSADGLRALQPLLQREIDEPNLVWWLRGERAISVNMLEAIRNGQVQQSELALPKGAGWHGWIMSWVPGSRAIHAGSSLRAWNQLVEASKLPTERQLDEFECVRKYCEQQDAVAAGLKFLCTMAVEHRPNQAMLRCALSAVAVERYRQERRRWPASLDAVVEAGFLKAVPIDPYDGKPLRFRALADGVFIYSAGADRIDNSGVLNRANPVAAGADIGFELWDPDKRGRPDAP
jgi:hypothetical protein